MAKILIKKILIFFIVLFIEGCSCLGPYGPDVSQYRNDNFQKRDNYFLNPTNNVLIFIDTTDNTIAAIQCHRSVSSFADTQNSSQSFNVYTPYAEFFEMSQQIESLREKFNKLSDIEKEQFLLQSNLLSPAISISCQSDGAGLDARAYFNGKEISSDRSMVRYAVVNLSFSIPLAEAIK